MGSQHQDIIEINGKKYNAVTGKIVSDIAAQSTESPQKIQPVPSTSLVRKTGVVDGFMRPKKAPSLARQVVHKKKTVQKSQTLMRTAVKKPQPVTRSSTKAHSSQPIQKSTIAPSKHLVRAAQNTSKSPMVSKFGDVAHRSSVIKKVEHLPVKAPVIHTTVQHESSAVSYSPAVAPQAPMQTTQVRSKATSALIEKALANATSHEQPTQHVKKSKRRRKLAHKFGVSSRAMALSTSVLAGVLLGGFFAIQNVPNLSMRVAAARAGFDASMPSYKPSGFSFKGPINYSAGTVTVSFKSNTDDRSYSITQRASNWNSDALLSNFVVAENKQYQTYIDRGRTLYIYDGSNATWVDNGVWYQVEGPSDMTTDQLVRVAASI